MSSELLAIKDLLVYSVQAVSGGAWIPSPLTYTEILLPRLKAGGKNVLGGQCNGVASGCIFAGHTFVAGVSVILATSTKNKSDSIKPMREGDAGQCIGSFTNNSSGAPVPCVCDVAIQVAGQLKSKGK